MATYSLSELVKNAYSLALTKLLYPSARLIRRPVYIRGRKGMVFGAGFSTGYRCRFDLMGSGVTLQLGENCKLGDHVHIVASKQVTVGDNCLFASHIFISDTDHGSGEDSPLTPPDDRPLVADPVSIGSNVWLGEGVAVLPGATIGDGCIIGAHAVVKGEIPPYTVAVGAPARAVKKYNFETNTWERC